jgi:hypothetical protein
VEEDRRSSDWWARAFGALGVLLLVLTAGLVFWPESERSAPAAAAPAAPLESAPVDLPFLLRQRLGEVLKAQTDALVKGDEKGWLAPVDKKVRDRYELIYRNLRSLEINGAGYSVEILDRSTEAVANARVTIGYCLSGIECPEWSPRIAIGAPKVLYDLTFTARNGTYVVTALKDVKNKNYLQPTPWEATELRFLRGKRVIVAGPIGQARNLRRVVTAADKAAAVVDRFTDKPPAVYRIYLADDKSWKRWYGGKLENWVVGYHIALNDTGSDIILNSSDVLDSSSQLAITVQHELAHAVTLVPSTNIDAAKDLWLIEGIAEYIGHYPKKPENSDSRYALRSWFDDRGAIKSVIRPELTAKSDDLTVSTLYATGHYAVGCMIDDYGTVKVREFVRRVLQEGSDPDSASRLAFGKPFSTVDKACVAWIKERV